MAKGLSLRICRVISSFRSCRSKDDAAAAAASAADSPVFRVSPANPSASTTLMEAAACPGELRRRRVPPTPAVCSCESEGLDEDLPPAYLWRKEEKWHVVARVSPSSPRRKIDSDGAGERELFPPLPVQRRSRRSTDAARKKKKKKKNKNKGGKPTRSRPRVSTSSADSHWFSSEDDDEEYMEDHDYGDDETEVLMSSSRSFSTFSSSSPEQNPRLKPIRESPTVDQYRHGAAARRGPSSPSPAARRSSSASVSSVLRKLMMTTPLCGAAVEGKVKESVAVVKRSADPYNDFRRSMVEMVVENQMYEESDLEQLLHCFLLLNSRRHHPAIVRAFSDVWATLFPFSHSCTSAVGTPPPAAVIS